MAVRGVRGLPGWLAVSWLALGAPVAAAQSTGLVGKWHWNRSESTSNADQPPPRIVVLDIAAAEPGRVEWTMTGTDAKGRQHVQAYVGTGDGKPAPVGGAPEGTMAAFTVTRGTMASSYSNRDGSAERTTCSITAGGDRMICYGTENDGKGHLTSFSDVYDRW